MRVVFAVLLASVLLSPAALAVGFQTSLNLGMETPNAGESRSTAYFLQGNLATLTKVVRFQSSFTALYGTNYMEAEGGVGVSLYPVSQFVNERANMHPFLIAMGTLGIGSLNKQSRINTGFGFGAGLDIKTSRRSGFSLSMQQHIAQEKSLRFMLGFFWSRQAD